MALLTVRAFMPNLLLFYVHLYLHILVHLYLYLHSVHPSRVSRSIYDTSLKNNIFLVQLSTSVDEYREITIE